MDIGILVQKQSCFVGNVAFLHLEPEICLFGDTHLSQLFFFFLFLRATSNIQSDLPVVVFFIV